MHIFQYIIYLINMRIYSDSSVVSHVTQYINLYVNSILTQIADHIK